MTKKQNGKYQNEETKETGIQLDTLFIF